MNASKQALQVHGVMIPRSLQASISDRIQISGTDVQMSRREVLCECGEVDWIGVAAGRDEI